MKKQSLTSETSTAKYDVVVIGGGPSGMMAAGRAASLGAKVVILEKNKTLGKKLLITGGGRCNVTNAEFDNQKLLAKFKQEGKFLFSPFSTWSVKETLEFFNSRNMPTKVEAEQRVFPVSDSAKSVFDALLSYLSESGVTVISNAEVVKLSKKNGLIEKVILKNGREIAAKAFVLATGGTSHPETGSTGDGYKWLRDLGHRVHSASASLVPIALKNPVKGAAGVSLKDIKVTLFQNAVKQNEIFGKVLFTHLGLSGPGILNLSRDIGELLKYGEVIVELDLFESFGYEKINEELQKIFRENSNKKIKNVLGKLIPPALSPYVLQTSDIDAETLCNSIKREERIRLYKTLKHLRFEVKKLLGMDKAITTSGGIDLKEVDFKTLSSIKFKNLFVVGDILNINRPSGGYSLQLCWTTGHVAGTSAANLALSSKESSS